MPHHDAIEVSGRIADVFHHRFVIETAPGRRILADLGPKGAEIFALEPGLDIVASGEMKPSELKVSQIARKGGATVDIPHKPKHDHHADAKPEVALAAVRKRGFAPVGDPRRKPKHFEILARSGRAYIECHVEFDGHIRKEKVVGPQDDKWASDIRASA